MTHYADIFVVPVPVKNIELYRRQAETFTKVWCDNGALSCIEFEADDAPVGELTSFPRSVNLKPDEKVFVGLATYESREKRDEVNAKAMNDPRMKSMEMSFDGKRMILGGFKSFYGD